MKKTSLLLVVISMFMFANTEYAHAFKLGSFDAGLNLSASLSYDDNVYLTNGNEVDDTYATISPGFYIKNSEDMNNELKLRYNADIYRYFDTSSTNDVEDHFASLLVHINKEGRVWLKFGDNFEKRHEDRGNLFVTTGNVTKLYSNDAELEVGLRVSEKFELALGYNFVFVDYTDALNAYRDRNENAGSLTVFYRVLPKTRLLVQGVYRNIYHPDDSMPVTQKMNSDEVWAMAGVAWDVTDKSTGFVKVGYEWKYFQHPQVNDFSTPVFIVGLKHDFTPKTSVSVTGFRRAAETEDPNTSYFTTTSGQVTISLHPIRKLSVSPTAGLEYTRYSGDTVVAGDMGKRRDNSYHCGIDLGYEIKEWLGVKVGYEFSKRSSTLPVYDYSKNLVTFTVSGTI